MERHGLFLVTETSAKRGKRSEPPVVSVGSGSGIFEAPAFNGTRTITGYDVTGALVLHVTGVTEIMDGLVEILDGLVRKYNQPTVS